MLRLFHGTHARAAADIVRRGFDLRMAGSNHGMTRGRGLYFTHSLNAALGYARTFGPIGNRCALVFVTDVLVGRSRVGKASFTRPPPLDDSEPTLEMSANLW